MSIARAKNLPYGEIYIDQQGEAHFDCHTPGGCSFEDSLQAFRQYVTLLQSKIDAHHLCPFFPGNTKS